MSIFKCNIKYNKVKGNSELSSRNNLVAHGFIDESYEILNDDFYKANKELNLLASNKLGKDVTLYDVKRKEDIIYYKDDAIKIGVDEKVKERIFNSQSELDIKNVLLNIQNNSKNSYFSKLASLLNNKILASDNIKIKLVNTKILKGNASGLYYPFYHSNKIFNENKVPFIEIAQKAEAPLFNLESVILHEIIHHLTHKALRNNSKLAKDWEKLYQHVKNTVKEEHYGLSDSDEFSTELFTNSRFIKTLKKYDATNEFKYANLFEELLDFIKSLFKTEYSFTLYDESFALLSNIIDDNYNYLLNQEREKNIEDEYYNQLDYFQFENEEEVLRAIPNTEVFKEIDLVNINKTEKNQVINQLKNEIIPADTGLLQFTRKPSNSELRSIFIGEQLSNYLSKESDSSSDSLYYRVTGRNFNEIWSSNEFTDDEKRRLLLHTIQKKLSDTNTFNGRLFRKINDRFGNLGVQLVNSDFIIYAQNGKINLDINKFYDYLKRENIENLNKYLDLGLAEELIHIVTSYITDANDIKNVLLEQIKNNDNFISMLNQKYRNENLSKNPNLIYNEYIRMLVQQEFLGTTTEQVKYTREGIINQIIAKVWEFLKSVATLPKTKEVIQKHIDFIKSDIEFEKQDSNIITPIDTSPDNQEGIDFVFEQNPELANIGTKEQYAEYIKTIFPESKLQNIVYHGTRKNSVNTNNYFKKLEGNKKDFGIYFADYSNHYVIKNEDNSYTQSIPIIVNIKNPKLINNEIEEGLSGAVLIDNNSFSVKKYYNITNQDGILEFGSYGNKNERISNEEFFNNLDKKNEEDYKIINNIFNNNIPSSMSKIIEKLNKKNNLNNLRVKEGLVFDPEQIYILGNKKDQLMFSNFVKNQFLPIEESNFDINIPCVTKK